MTQTLHALLHSVGLPVPLGLADAVIESITCDSRCVGSTEGSDEIHGIDVASDSGLSGMAIGSLTADASSTAGSATATAGESDLATGALLPSLNVGGISDLTGAAQLDSSATASH